MLSARDCVFQAGVKGLYAPSRGVYAGRHGGSDRRRPGIHRGTRGIKGHVVTIDVLKVARRTGVGSMLLGSAEDRLKRGGSKAVGLETAVDNTEALKFYKRHGYSVFRTWPHYYSNGVDALVLRKDLV